MTECSSSSPMQRAATRTGLTLVAALVMATPALAAPKAASVKGDAVHGQAVFAQCKICHSVEPGKNLIGPSLSKVVGRKAGSIAGFMYSPAMKKSAVTWTPKELSDFVTAPMKKVPGTRMAFAGISNPADRDDLIAYLAKN